MSRHPILIHECFVIGVNQMFGIICVLDDEAPMVLGFGISEVCLAVQAALSSGIAFIARSE